MGCCCCKKADAEIAALKRLASAVLTESVARERWNVARCLVRDRGDPEARVRRLITHGRYIKAEVGVQKALAALLRARGKPLPRHLEVVERLNADRYSLGELASGAPLADAYNEGGSE